MIKYIFYNLITLRIAIVIVNKLDIKFLEHSYVFEY